MSEPQRNLPPDDRAHTRPNLNPIDGGGEGDGVPAGDLREAEGIPDSSHIPQEDKPVTRPDLKGIRGEGKGDGTPRGVLRNAEENQAAKKADQSKPDNDDSNGFSDKLGKGFNRGKEKLGRTKGVARVRRRYRYLMAIIGIVSTLSLGSFFVLGTFTLQNFLKNVEERAFIRYQVDLRGRSTKWLEAYMLVRMGEFENPDVEPKDRDNVFFRADRVDNNKYLTDWYRTMRTSKFEQEMFESRGIKFTSMSYWNGSQYLVRPALLTFPGGEVRIDPRELGYDSLDAIANGDVNRFNGQISDLFEAQVYENDREARKAIALLLKDEYPGFWKAAKRWHMRQDIQNMIGVRSWRFFEQSREKWAEQRTTARNKLIKSALPEDSKSGKFVGCLFGLDNCSASKDVADPKRRQIVPDGTQKQPDKQVDTDGDPNTPPQTEGDGQGDKVLADRASKAGAEANKLATRLASKAGLIGMIDALARFNQAVNDHSISEFITQAKMAQAAGVFTGIMIAGDQLTTGQVNGEEVGEFMGQFQNYANSEAWNEVIDDPSASSVAAASNDFAAARSKKEYCSNAYQEEMRKPENRQAAERQFAYACAKDRVSGKNFAEQFENAWNSGPGAVLKPIGDVYLSTAGKVFDFIVGDILGAIQQAGLDALGLSDDLVEVVGWVGEQAVAMSGATLDLDGVPSGQVANQAIQGAAVVAEGSMRFQGGAETTPAARQYSEQKYAAYLQEERELSTFSERYFAVSNHKSVLFQALAKIDGFDFNRLGSNIFGLFGSTVSSTTNSLFSQPAQAGGNGTAYSASNFAGIDSYDLPKECIEADVLTMTPRSATNADDLGYFAPDELTWELLSDKKTWFDALYDKVGGDDKKALKVWNCGLIDNTVRGGIGARYGVKGEGAYGKPGASSSTAPSSTTSGSGEVDTDDYKVMARKLIESGRLKGDPRYIGQIEAIKNGDYSCNVNPTILKMLYGVVVQDNHTLYVSSLNRRCTGVLTTSGVGSFHYRANGGHAIDITSFNGKATTGYSGSGSKGYLESASKYLPAKTGYGQISCGSGFKLPSGSYPVPDECDHQHLQVPERQLQ